MTSTRRRRLTLAIAALLAAPYGATAQQPGRVYRMGFLAFGERAVVTRNLRPFLDALAKAGFEDGRNLVVELRVVATESEPLDDVARELAALHLDVVFIPSPNGAKAMRRATAETPIVALLGSDPVADGLAVSLARPGGNVTGVNVLAIDTNQKRLELLSELYPGKRQIGYLTQKANLRFVEETRPLAQKLGLSLEPITFETIDELEARFPKTAPNAMAILVGGTPVNFVCREAIVRLANRARIAIVYPSVEYAEAGGLISYGGDLPFAIGRAMQIVVLVLKGGKPSEIPFEQATRINLTVNRKTAAAIGMQIPQGILLRADRLIE